MPCPHPGVSSFPLRIRPLRSMSARILLVRHGRSAHDARGWLDAAGVRDWLTAYDVAGLALAEQPPPTLRAAAANADCIVASDLRRARASAALLAPDRTAVISPLLREATMVIPRWTRARLPVPAWALVLGARWLYAVRRDEAPIVAARDQGAAAAAWLAQLASPDGFVVAVTHHTIRGFVAAALATRGWSYDGTRPRPLQGRYAHWSAWPMTRAAER